MAENQESIFGFEKSPRNCHSSVDNKRKIEMERTSQQIETINKNKQETKTKWNQN